MGGLWWWCSASWPCPRSWPSTASGPPTRSRSSCPEDPSHLRPTRTWSPALGPGLCSPTGSSSSPRMASSNLPLSLTARASSRAALWHSRGSTHRTSPWTASCSRTTVTCRMASCTVSYTPRPHAARRTPTSCAGLCAMPCAPRGRASRTAMRVRALTRLPRGSASLCGWTPSRTRAWRGSTACVRPFPEPSPSPAARTT
mmetsp:Transcript_13741/g.46442  ORF Transcript_13741/g.46442 Transcript_13741/m.46442 type:complete len:200 (+) Transcript_13741:124-723(+)